MTTVALLDRSRIVAHPGWSRRLVPPAARSIHLAIGSAYAWSVFEVRLEKSLHVSAFGTHVDHYGPRWAMVVATACFCSGLLIAGFGVSVRADLQRADQAGGDQTSRARTARRRLGARDGFGPSAGGAPMRNPSPDRRVGPALIALAWLWVAVPFSYGVWQLFSKISELFDA